MIRAILVDDKKAHLKLLIKALGHYNRDLEIIGAFTNAGEAVTQIIHLVPDVLFLDIEMPGKTGFELAASVKAICGNVIYLTSYEKYGPDSYRHNAIHFIVKERMDEFLPEAVAKLKAMLSVVSTVSLRKITIKDGRRISLTLHNATMEFNMEDILLKLESYGTLSKFIAYKLIGTATDNPNDFTIHYKRDEKIFTNLSQERSNFMKDIDGQLAKEKIHLLPDSFFRCTEKGDYTLSLNAAAIIFDLNPQSLKLWAECYLKPIIKLKNLKMNYSIDDNDIRIFKN